MLIDVVNVKILDGYNLLLHFNDGNSGKVNVEKIVKFEGVFSSLKDYDFFTKVRVNSDIGTICWENGADIAPDFLYNEALKAGRQCSAPFEKK